MADKIFDSFGAKRTLTKGNKRFTYFSLPEFSKQSGLDLTRLPYSIKVLLENLLRHEDGKSVLKEDIEALASFDGSRRNGHEIQFMPARVLLQDFTGVPGVVDLAAVRSALKRLGGDESEVNPHIPVDLVIDHSIQVDSFGTSLAFLSNEEIEFSRNKERYQLLKWARDAFDNFSVVPPNTGICHQVNLEFLSKVAMTREKGRSRHIFPDTLVGTDSHTPMINGLGVLGWGVGGIEAEAVLLGQPYSMLIPDVVGVKFTGQLPTGATATDLVLTVTNMLREKGVVGKFVEYFGAGLGTLTIADRATLANMTPEYGATVGIFPVDGKTIEYLELTGRGSHGKLVETYFQKQGLWYEPGKEDPLYTDMVELDLNSVEPSLAGPKRPQDRVPLKKVRNSFHDLMDSLGKHDAMEHEEHLACWLNEGGCYFPGVGESPPAVEEEEIPLGVSRGDGTSFVLSHGSVVISAITSCTNTSNPYVMVAAGLIARNAIRKGLHSKPWVKTSFAPGSKAVTDYLEDAGLMPYLEGLGYHLVGYGCTTCIGNSGPLPKEIGGLVEREDLVVASVLSGNRNFEGRIHNQVRANYLGSPPLVVAYALAGHVDMDMETEPLGLGPLGQPVFLKDIWPKREEIEEIVNRFVTPAKFEENYADVYDGNERWNAMDAGGTGHYEWDTSSTYIKEPPYFIDFPKEPEDLQDLEGARVIALLGDSVTTDHISPAGAIPAESPAGEYLISKGVKQADFNSYGSRRGNHEVMVRGTFANVRLRNLLLPGVEGGFTKLLPGEEQMPIYDAAMKYKEEGTPLIVMAGKEYGTGSSRDWAAKGVLLLGIRAVIAEGYERIHRSNLIGMGVLPLQFLPGENRETLGLTGRETYSIQGISGMVPGAELKVTASNDSGEKKHFNVKARIDTPNELDYFNHGGILHYVLRQILKKG